MRRTRAIKASLIGHKRPNPDRASDGDRAYAKTSSRQVALAVRRRVDTGPRGWLGRAAGTRADEGLDFGGGGGCDCMFCQLIFASFIAVNAMSFKSFAGTSSAWTRRRGTVSNLPMRT